MTKEMHFDFPIEPVAKGRPRVTKGGHAFTPAKTRKAEDTIKSMAESQMKNNLYDPIVGKPIEVWVDINFKRPKSNRTEYHIQRPDLDNCAKLVLDACNGIVWGDDSQIVQLHICKQWSDEFGIGMMVREGYYTFE